MIKSVEKTDINRSQFDPEAWEELFRRDQVGPETFARSGTGSSIVAGSRGGSSELTPTERAAEHLAFGRKVRDPFREDLRELERWVFEFETLSAKIVERQKYLFEAQEKTKTITTTEPCLACGVLPIIRTGFCEDCYVEWQEHGSPDRTRWIAYKTGTRNSAGELLVEGRPNASPSVKRILGD